MIENPFMPNNRVTDRIIRSRGEIPSSQRTDGGNDPYAYQAAIYTEGFPQMAFSLFCTSGKRHVFYYHNIDNLDLTDGKHGSYVTMSHRGKVVTMQGQHLHEMLNGMIDHTLQAVYEFDPAAYTSPPEGEPMIEFVRVDDINPQPQKSKDEASA